MSRGHVLLIDDDHDLLKAATDWLSVSGFCVDAFDRPEEAFQFFVRSDPDVVVYTYNGESIGRWEKDALVVHTKYLEPNEHYIDSGIPISDQFEIVERITMESPGMLRIDYTLTDPKMWKGEWKSTKRFIRKDYSDIPESNCLPNLNEDLPSTAEGQRALQERARGN